VANEILAPVGVSGLSGWYAIPINSAGAAGSQIPMGEHPTYAGLYQGDMAGAAGLYKILVFDDSNVVRASCQMLWDGSAEVSATVDLSGIPAAVRSELATELGHLDADISSRMADDATLEVDLSGIPAAVRSELATELAHLDADISSRMADDATLEVGIDVAEIAGAIAAQIDGFTAEDRQALAAILNAAEDGATGAVELTSESIELIQAGLAASADVAAIEQILAIAMGHLNGLTELATADERIRPNQYQKTTPDGRVLVSKRVNNQGGGIIDITEQV